MKLPNIEFPHRRFYTTNDPVLTPDLIDYFLNVRRDTFRNLSARKSVATRFMTFCEPYGAEVMMRVLCCVLITKIGLIEDVFGNFGLMK